MVEFLLAGRGRIAFLRSLRQPNWALPLPMVYGAGLLFYATTAFMIARMLLHETVGLLPLVLAILIFLVDIALNIVTFRFKRFGQALWWHLPYAVFVIAISASAWQWDRPSAILILILINLVLIGYGFIWTAAVRRLNPGVVG